MNFLILYLTIGLLFSTIFHYLAYLKNKNINKWIEDPLLTASVIFMCIVLWPGIIFISLDEFNKK
jgi:integral membrane sensor domain MASE1